MTAYALTANDLLSGAVIWANGQGGWTTVLAAAALWPSEEAAAPALAAADPLRVVGPCLVAVAPSAVPTAPPRPLALREFIRAAGPTIALPAFPHEAA